MKKDIAGFSIQDYLLGDVSTQKWIAIMILANVMVFVMYQKRVTKGIQTNLKSPDRFSWAYFIANNLLEVLRTELSIYLFARAALLFIEPKYVIAFAIFIGLISDQLPWIFNFIKAQGLDRIKTFVVKLFGGSKPASPTDPPADPNKID